MINLNGQLFENGTPLIAATNRSFRYGDSIFESIRMLDGNLPFLEYHWERLQRGAEILKIQLPHGFSPDFLRDEMGKTAEHPNCRFRLTIFRSGTGLYTPHENQSGFLIECTPLESDRFYLPEDGSNAGIARSVCLFPTPWSSFKTGNSLTQVMAGLEKEEAGWDDICLVNHAGRLGCGLGSNLFCVQGKELLTPPLSEGCVAGVMRRILLEIAEKKGIRVTETVIEKEDLARAEEVLLTNAVAGIKWIREIAGIRRKYGQELGNRLTAWLNEILT